MPDVRKKAYHDYLIGSPHTFSNLLFSERVPHYRGHDRAQILRPKDGAN